MNSRELEREVERTRASLDLTIDRLQHRLSPFGLMDETLGLLRSKRFNRSGDAMMSAMRRDPLPALLIAAGVGLLIYRASRPKPYPTNGGRARTHEMAVGGPYPPEAPGRAAPPPIEPAADPRRGRPR